MKISMRLFVVLVILSITTASLLSGCAKPVTDDVVIRIGILPILDVLPLAVAESAGFYEENNVRVELVSVASAAERDQLFQAGQLDAMVTDLVALALINRNTSKLVGVRYTMRPTENHAQFSIVSSPESDIIDAASLAGVDVALSEGTIIEYVATRMLAFAGVAGDEFQPLAVPKMPERLALLNGGGVLAAALPEPLATLAASQGGTILIDDTNPALQDYSCSVFAFRAEFLEEHPDTVKAFLFALDQASDAINAEKTSWDNMLTELKLIPAPLSGNYELPDYPAAGIPTPEMFEDVTAWLQKTGRLDNPTDYDNALSSDFID